MTTKKRKHRKSLSCRHGLNAWLPTLSASISRCLLSARLFRVRR